MGVEIVAHHVPRRRSGEQDLQERHVVRLRAAVVDSAKDLAGGDIERCDKGLRGDRLKPGGVAAIGPGG